MLFSIVVPIYNEEETLFYSLEKLRTSLDTLELSEIDQFEFILVNDGSADRSAELISEAATEYKLKYERFKIRQIDFSRNFGHSAAVLAGLTFSNGDFVAIIDADLQDPPELIPKMYNKLKEGFDVVYGKRISRDSESYFKKVTAWCFYRVLKVFTEVKIPTDTGDFRVITKTVAKQVSKLGEQDPFMRGLVAWVGFKQAAFPYDRVSRKFGETKYPFRKMLKFALNSIVNFSGLPLQLSIVFSLLSVMACMSLGFWAIYQHYIGETVPGWTSILMVTLVCQSMTLAVMSIFGLYLYKIHKGVLNRPIYIIKDMD